MESDTDLAVRAIEVTCAAPDLDEALNALVTTIRSRFELWYGCFASHTTDAPAVKVLASWSVAESVFDAGAEVSATISPIVISVLETLRQGSGATFVVGGNSDSLIDHLLEEQGVASLLALPIHCDERSLFLLTLGSSSPKAFQELRGGFFTTLSTGIQSSVLRLAAATQP